MKKRAATTPIVRSGRDAKPRRRRAPARLGAAGYFPILAFGLIYAGAAAAWGVAPWVGALYLASSLVCSIVYAADKSAAVAGRWRVSESTLLFLGLAGGWPGAIVAQETLRHKSSKTEFRSAFWATVALNVLAFVWLFTPLHSLLRR